MNRRDFVRSSALGLTAMGLLPPRFGSGKDYGPLRPDPQGLLDLPEGFHYTVLFRAGDRMNDGLHLPMYPAQIGLFPGGEGELLLLLNHAVPVGSPSRSSAFGFKYTLLGEVSPERLYDPGAEGKPGGNGGTTTLVLDAAAGYVKHCFLSLGGTLANGAGCVSPGGTWLSAESVYHPQDERYRREHGFLYEVHPARRLRDSWWRVLPHAGVFPRLALCTVPDSGFVYQAEAGETGCLFRCLLEDPTAPLEALQVTGERLSWVPVDEPTTAAEAARTSGATPVTGLSGLAFSEGMVTFNARHDDGFAEYRFRSDPKKTGEIRQTSSLPSTSQPGLALTLGREQRRAQVMTHGVEETLVGWAAERSFPIACSLRGISGAAFDEPGRRLFLSIRDAGLVVVQGPW